MTQIQTGLPTQSDRVEAKPTALSTQEEAIQNGKKTLHEGMSERIVTMHDAVRSHGAPTLTLSRARRQPAPGKH